MNTGKQRYIPAAICLWAVLAGCAATGKDASMPVRFFREYISPIDGDRCPMHPTCSAYAVESLRKHGPVLGWIMTCDRLLRCGGDEIARSPLVRINDKYYCDDPVENNDFWY